MTTTVGQRSERQLCNCADSLQLLQSQLRAESTKKDPMEETCAMIVVSYRRQSYLYIYRSRNDCASLHSSSRDSVAIHRIPISHEVFIQLIHRLHVRRVNLEPSHIAILDDPRVSHALGQWYKAVLQAPSDHELRRRTGIFGRQRTDGGMLHPKRSGERRVCLNNDIVLLAKRGDLGPGIEWVDFDLIDRRMGSGFRGNQLLQLGAISKSPSSL